MNEIMLWSTAKYNSCRVLTQFDPWFTPDLDLWSIPCEEKYMISYLPHCYVIAPCPITVKLARHLSLSYIPRKMQYTSCKWYQGSPIYTNTVRISHYQFVVFTFHPPKIKILCRQRQFQFHIMMVIGAYSPHNVLAIQMNHLWAAA